MPLSSLPTGGPTLPAGAQKVSLKQISTDTAAASNNVDVTTLSDLERKYASPPLVEPAGGSANVTATCSASGLLKSSSEPIPSDSSVTTGWVCEDTEVVYEQGKYATWSANWSYYASEE